MGPKNGRLMGTCLTGLLLMSGVLAGCVEDPSDGIDSQHRLKNAENDPIVKDNNGGEGAQELDGRDGEGSSGPVYVKGTFRVIEVNCCQRNFELHRDGSCRILSLNPWGDEIEEHCTYNLNERKLNVEDEEESLALEYVTDDLLRIGDHQAAVRRVHDDGSIVDYPQVLSASFLKGSTTTIYLRLDGTLTYEFIDEYGGFGKKGVYDLWLGFVEWEDGDFETIIFLEDGNLNVGAGVFNRRS